MATFGQMIDEVTRKLSGYTLRQDRQTYLTNDISTTDMIIAINNAQNISHGLVQIGDELVYVESFDRSAGTLIVPPYGRGYDGTTATSHLAGERVVISPTFPRIDVANAINETIMGVAPDLYATGSYTFPFSPAVSTYALPNEADSVLSISYQVTGPTKEWLPVRGWRQDRMANTSTFNSRNTVTIYSGVEPGRTVQVFYTTEPSVLDTYNDDFAITTGLPESCKDVIVLGAAARLASFIDPGRLTFGSAEADQQSQIAGRAYGAGTNASKYLLALYQQRLNEETRKLQERNPIRVHWTR